MTQADYNKLWEPPEMDLPRAYAAILKAFLTAIVYMPFFPLGLLIAAFAMYRDYHAFKRTLLRKCRRSYTQGPGLAYKALRWLFVAAAALGGSMWCFLSPSIR